MRKPYLLILAICFFSCEEAPVFEAPDPVETPVVAIQTIETIFTKLPIEIVWEGNTTSREFIYELQYEKFVEDPETESKKLLDYCNLPWDKRCLEYYKRKDLISRTTSNLQVRKAVYKHSAVKNNPYRIFLQKFEKKYAWFK